MPECKSCGKKLSWYHFKREICQSCSQNWEGLLAKANVAASEAEISAEQAKKFHDGAASSGEPEEYFDLSSLLSSIHVKEESPEDLEFFTNIWAPAGYPTRSFLASLTLHACFVGLIWGLSGISFSEPLPLTKEDLERDYQITYYRPSDLLPKINSASDGPRTPAGQNPKVKPPKGSTSFHPTQTIQSSPVKPDNSSQSIVQPSTPEVQIKQEVKVPNIVIWNVPEAKVESLEIANKKISPLLSPKPETPDLQPPDPDIKLDTSISDLKIAKAEVVNLQAKLTVPVGASAEWNIASDAGTPGPLVNVPSADGASDRLRNLVVLSANPGLPGPGGLKVPAGNKTGAFSISPEGNRAGSPDGSDGGEVGGGVLGGGGSGGTGSGFGGGGNIASIQIPGMSVKGGPNGGGSGIAGPGIAAPGKRPRSPSGGFSDMQTFEDPGESYNITVVEGRTGGAGLGVYGVLSGKRNYTVFIPMPSGRWTMQFSEMPDKSSRSGSTQPASAQLSGAQVLVSAGDAIVQPRPLRKVDPGRPEDEELARLRGLVVLYAVIRKDGGVDRIRIIRSLNPALDERAAEALKHWKFKPAQLAENLIEVQALFGIPFKPLRQ
jgi:TonB family protein